MNKHTDEIRIAAQFEKRRRKLLDLTPKNPMLNFNPTARTRRHVGIADDPPQSLFRRLWETEEEAKVIPLPEPNDIPEDEQTEEFAAELARHKATDPEYLLQLEAIVSAGRDDEFEMFRLDRAARDVLREKLGKVPRPERNQINLGDLAHHHGIDPSIELPPQRERRRDRQGALQTMLLAESFQARLEGIQDLARSSQQEMGFSTLFIALGFLEWYDSPQSEKAHFAPLVLLPVGLQTQVTQGPKTYGVAPEKSPAAGFGDQPYV